MTTYDLTSSGISITNLLTYGDFENTGWSGSGSFDTAHVKYGKYARKMTGNTSAPEVLAYHSGGANLVQNHIYYCRMEVYHEGAAGSVGFYFPEAEPSFQDGISLGPANQWNICSGRNVRSNWSSSSSATFRIDYNNVYNATSVWIDGAMCIDLTACFGSGKEPTKEWCDKNIPFFTGIMKLYPKIKTGDIFNVPYSGEGIGISLPKGTYKLEVWGAEGGGRRLSGNADSGLGGYGGYSVGTLTLTAQKIAYLYAGGTGKSTTSGLAEGGFNGGGCAWASSAGEPGNGGGGGSDIRIGQDSLYARIIVAGGGGGGGEDSSDYIGHGGGTSGIASSSGTAYPGTATGASGGGAFGQGAHTPNDGGGGGGGWYGGGTTNGSQTRPTSNNSSDTSGGSGGSGYVYTSSTASQYPSGCLLDSSMYLTDASTKAGNTSFTSPTASSETGHHGAGYCRITVISVKSLNLPTNIGGTWHDSEGVYVNIGGTWKEVEAVYVNIGGAWKSVE